MKILHNSPGNGVHDVNGGDASLDHLLRVCAGPGVDGLACRVTQAVRQPCICGYKGHKTMMQLMFMWSKVQNRALGLGQHN